MIFYLLSVCGIGNIIMFLLYCLEEVDAFVKEVVKYCNCSSPFVKFHFSAWKRKHCCK